MSAREVGQLVKASTRPFSQPVPGPRLRQMKLEAFLNTTRTHLYNRQSPAYNVARVWDVSVVVIHLMLSTARAPIFRGSGYATTTRTHELAAQVRLSVGDAVLAHSAAGT